MSPLPKRKHSTARKGRRMNAKKVTMTKLVKCSHCNQPKMPHRVCKKCGK